MTTKQSEEKNELFYVYHDQFVIITPKNHMPTLPVACPVCDFILADSNDDICYK